MTPRKPPGVSIEDHVERQIRDAAATGAFDSLPGAGQPLPDLNPADSLWWLRRKLQREGFEPPLPPALELRRDVGATLEKLAARDPESSEAFVRLELEKLNARIRRANRTSWKGPATTLSPIHVDRWIARWRAGR